MLLTIDSAGRLLDLFTTEVPERGVTEVAYELDVSKSKAHALLASLAHVGLLRRTDGGRYRLGWRCLAMSRVLDATTDFHQHARPIMRILSDRYRETVHLATLNDGQVVYVDRLEGAERVAPAISDVGSILPANCSAVGKVLLSALSGPQLSDLVDRHGLPALTSDSITDPLELAEQLDDVRACGYAVEHGEASRGFSCVAAPIVAPGPRTVAAISVSVATPRFVRNEATFRQAVVLAAHHISRALREDDAAPAARAVPSLAAA